MNSLRNIMALMLAIVVLAPAAFAADAYDGYYACVENSQKYAAATWAWENGEWVLIHERPSYDTQVTGDVLEAQWSSNKRIAAAFAIRSSGSEEIGTKAFAGSVSGDEPMQLLVLCLKPTGSKPKAITETPSDEDVFGELGERNGLEGEPHEIPEFGGLVAFGAIGLLGAGLVAYKRRD